MKNSVKNILIISFVITLGLVVYFVSQNKTPLEETKEVMTSKETSPSMMEPKDTMVEEEKMMDKKEVDTRYAMYSKEVLNSSATTRKVLFFYASWCPTCKPADENLQANTSLLPEDVTVIRVNYKDTDTDQEEKDLAEKYGITYQHTFVQIDEQGNEITKWNGGKIDELLANIK